MQAPNSLSESEQDGSSFKAESFKSLRYQLTVVQMWNYRYLIPDDLEKIYNKLRLTRTLNFAVQKYTILGIVITDWFILIKALIYARELKFLHFYQISWQSSQIEHILRSQLF